ncbi:MAG TPA: hypothetical protein VN408_28485 [Actinoplanes sp.]|nr:hypothetical protein [Actinoplanes sp.]
MNCGVAALLRPGGPVRVPLRDCCVAALLGADGVTTASTCLAVETVPGDAPFTELADLVARTPLDEASR